MGNLSNMVCCCPNQELHQKHSIVQVKDLKSEGNYNNTIKDSKKIKKSTTLEEIEIKAATGVYERKTNPNDMYEFIEELGEGAFGRVVKVRHKKTDEIRAMKVIMKDQLQLDTEMDEAQLEEIANEINILKSLDHPNIIKVYEYFDYKDKIYIINELAPDGNLFELLKEKKKLYEPLALKILHQILSSVCYLHSENVVHGDIKPENIMIDNYHNCQFSNKKTPSANDLKGFDIKLIDFGTSKVYSKEGIFDKLVGTSFYVAPEVILGSYHRQCDLWSCGIVLYVMLSGDLPFYANEDQEVFEMIKNQKIDFKLREFTDISSESMKLLKSLLEKDPLERITADNALNHECFNMLNKLEKKEKDINIKKQISKNALARLGTINNQKTSKFSQAITTFITHNFLSKEVSRKHAEIFKALDENGDGRLTNKELTDGYTKAGYNYLPEEIDAIISSIDKDNNGYIELEEFISSAVNLNILLSDTNVKLAFETIDTDNSGSISFQEISQFIGGGELDENLMKKVVEQVGKTSEDEFEYTDFKNIMEILKSSDLKIDEEEDEDDY
jgi:calcium-dependent protein kinase